MGISFDAIKETLIKCNYLTLTKTTPKVSPKFVVFTKTPKIDLRLYDNLILTRGDEHSPASR